MGIMMHHHSWHAASLDLDLVFVLQALALANGHVVRMELGHVGWRRIAVCVRVHWLWLWWGWRRLRHGPHVHGDGPVGLDHSLPDLREDDLAVGTNEIVVTFVDMGADHVDVEEGLLDEFFHTLEDVRNCIDDE